MASPGEAAFFNGARPPATAKEFGILIPFIPRIRKQRSRKQVGQEPASKVCHAVSPFVGRAHEVERGVNRLGECRKILHVASLGGETSFIDARPPVKEAEAHWPIFQNHTSGSFKRLSVGKLARRMHSHSTRGGDRRL
jgi:hypothetical protein